MADMKLYYFDARGRAEPIRMTLVAGGKKFEDCRVSGDDWKAKAPNGLVPYLEYKGKTYGESKAIASFVARECGLAGKTSEDAMRVDEVFCLFSDILESLARMHFEPDAARKEKLEKDFEELCKKYLANFEKMLKENGTGYFVGNSVSLADFAVYDITTSFGAFCDKLLDSYPETQKMRKNVEANPKIKAYLDSRPKNPF